MATAREQLAQFAAGSKALGRLCREYKNRSATVHLEELVGGALSFYAAAAVAESGGVHVFVAEDRDAAAYLLNDFYNLLDELRDQTDKTYLLVAHNGIARVVQSYFYDMTNEEYAMAGIKNCELVEYHFE